MESPVCPLIMSQPGHELDRDPRWRSRKQWMAMVAPIVGPRRLPSRSGDSPGFPESCERQQADEKRSALPSPHGCCNTYTQEGRDKWKTCLTQGRVSGCVRV